MCLYVGCRECLVYYSFIGVNIPTLFSRSHTRNITAAINGMFNYIPLAEREINNFWENREYIISEDISSVLFLAPIKDKAISGEFFSKTSRMTSFFTGAAVNDNSLFLVGSIVGIIIGFSLAI
mgnify:CR=1 FL=1